jgi:hypothetical protein
MKRLGIAAAATLAWLGISAGTASAQFSTNFPQLYQYPSTSQYDQFNRSQLSPYLNLTRGGSNAANYYLGVVPEIQRRNFEFRAANDFSSIYSAATQAPQTLEDPLWRLPFLRVSPPTGHLTGFQTYGSFYNFNPYRR